MLRNDARRANELQSKLLLLFNDVELLRNVFIPVITLY